MNKTSSTVGWRSITVLGIAAGIFYSSWPLGYWLNPAVSTNALASGLEAVGQPYNWLFIATDCISAALMLILCWVLWQKYNGHKHKPLLGTILVMVVIFAIGTMLDALLPEKCIPAYQVCPSFRHDHLLFTHGLFSIGASVGLFVSLVLLWWQERWSKLLNGLMVAYILFGLISLVEAILPGDEGNWSQHYYITLCSIWLATLPFAIHNYLSPPADRSKKSPDLSTHPAKSPSDA